MRVQTSIARDVLLLVVAAGACLAPTGWLAIPGAAVLVLWLPGRSIVRLLPPLTTGLGVVFLTIALSIVLLPVPLHWLWQVTNDRAAVFVVVLGVNALLLAIAAWRSAEPAAPTAGASDRGAQVVVAAAALWIGGCVAGTYILPELRGGATTPSPHDYIKHHVVLLSLEQYPLPLHNYFYAAEADTPYYYYDYHYLLAAAIRVMTGLRGTIALVFGLTSAATAIAMIGVVYLLAVSCLGSVRAGALAAVCAGVVGAWDVVPRALSAGRPVVTLDAWTGAAWRIHNLATQYMWCPQHVASLLALMVACLGLSRAPLARWWILAAPLIAASLFGSSVYLAMTIFPTAAIWSAIHLRTAVRERRIGGGPAAGALAAIAVLGFALMARQGWHYHVMSARYNSTLTVAWDRMPYAFFGRLVAPGPLANWLDAPWVLLIEFGLGALALPLLAPAVVKRIWADAGMRLLIMTAVLGTAAMLTVRSAISPIDYSFRVSVMPASVVAALLAGALADRAAWRPFAQRLRMPILVIGVALGLPIGAYEAPGTAGRVLIEPPRYGADAGAIAYLRHSTPMSAVVQGHPKYRLLLPQLTDRTMGVLDPDDPDVRVFPPLDPARMRQAFNELSGVFLDANGAAAWATLHRWGVTHVLYGRRELKLGPGSALHDATWFDCVYDDGQAAVYRLKNTAVPTDATRPAQENPPS